jgi:TRAP-type transport system small permease protein
MKVIDRILFVTIGCLLAAMVADVAMQIVFRYVIGLPPTWSEELARFLFAWQIFLAAGLAFGRGSHIAVDALVLVMPAAGKRVLACISHSIVLAFLCLLVWEGISMARMTADTSSAAMGLNMGVVYAALPTGAIISAAYVAMHLVGVVRGTRLESQGHVGD